MLEYGLKISAPGANACHSFLIRFYRMCNVHHIQFTQYSHGFSKISWIYERPFFSIIFLHRLEYLVIVERMSNRLWLDEFYKKWCCYCYCLKWVDASWDFFFLHLVKMLIKMDCAPNFESLARFETSDILAVVSFCFSEMLSLEMPYFYIYLSIDCLRCTNVINNRVA